MPGLGLRAQHFPYLEGHKPRVARWFEAISENYLDSYGRPRQMLRKVRNDFPVALHGVSLSLASATGVDMDYLLKLKQLANELEPMIVSDHLCWTRVKRHTIHDLLPFPFTDEAADHVVANIHKVQETLGRQIAVENISSYICFESSCYEELEFLNAVCSRTDCRILLDLNNLYVNASNHKFNAYDYLAQIDHQRVAQIHLAGYSDTKEFLFDTHAEAVHPPVWKLFGTFIANAPSVPFMIEWDQDIPEFKYLEEQLQIAVNIWTQSHCIDSKNTSTSTLSAASQAPMS